MPHLFLLAPPLSVSPYAGHYPHTTAAEERRQMNVLLVEQGLAARENEPSDHIAVQLALMARMVAKEEKFSAQYYFLHLIIFCAGHRYFATHVWCGLPGVFILRRLI